MSGFVIIVDFRLKPGRRADFRKFVDVNAAASVRYEPGCRRFDVLEVQGESDRVLLYEIYDDEAAFEQHCSTRHFHEFDALSAPLVAQKTVSRCDLVLEPRARNKK